MSTRPAQEYLTILRTAEARYRACKRFRWLSGLNQWSKEQYKSGALFTFHSRPIASIDDLAEILEKIRRDQRSFIVRGIPTEEAKAIIAKISNAKLRRRKNPHGDVPATLKETALSWLMLDIDNFQLPGTADLVDDPESAIDHAIHTLLPIEFHAVRCWWQLSNSAGLDPGVLKVHLFFWLSEPKTNADLKKYFSGVSSFIDCSIFHATQPLYVADPVIEGRPDWLQRRTGWRDGTEDSVCLPEIGGTPSTATIIHAKTNHNSRLSPGINEILSTIGDEAGLAGFYNPSRDAAFQYALETPISQRDDESFKEKVRTAITAAVNRDPSRHKPEDVAIACSDERLDQLINSAFKKLGADVGKRSPENFQFIRLSNELSLKEARRRLSVEIESFFRRAISFHQKGDEVDLGTASAETAALAVDVGVGKTRSAIQALKNFIAQAQALELPHRALYFVPTHRLGAEILEIFVRLGVAAATFRGREADDLESADTESSKRKMCRDLAAVNDARLLGLDPERAACGSVNSEWRCGYFSNCAYQKQKDAAAKADVVILANEFVYANIPKFLIKKIGVAIIDESVWQRGIEERSLKSTSFGRNFDAFPVLHIDEKAQEIDLISTKILAETHTKLSALLDKQQDGYIQKEVFLNNGFDPDICALAAKYEFRRKVFVSMRPGLTQAQRDELKEKAAINSQVKTLADFWSLLGSALAADAEARCGRLELITRHSAQGTERLIILRRRRDFGSLLRRIPVLMLDATFPAEIVRRFAPTVRLLAEIRVATPFMRVTTVIGAGFGKNQQRELMAPDADDAKRRRRARQREFVHGLGFGGRTLVITYLAAEPGYEGLEGVEVAHFGAVAGRDGWGPQDGQGGIKTLFVIGRPMPSPLDVRHLTVALTGKAIPPLVPIEVIKVPQARGGQAHPISTLAYEDADAEAIRWAICEGEVIQAIGRARGVSRTVSNPVSVFLLANVVLPLDIDSVVRWENVVPRAVEALLLRGILPLSGQDAALLAPDLFPSAEGAEVAGRAIREAFGDEKYSCKPEFTNISCINTLYKEKVGEFRWLIIAYRRQGRGHRTTQMLVRADLLDGLSDRLTERLGPLAKFEVLPSSDRSAHLEVIPFTHEADPERPAGTPPLPQIEPASAQQQSAPSQPESAPPPWLDIDLGPEEASGTVVVLGNTPPLPGERLTPQPPPVSPQPLKLIPADEITLAKERLLALEAALEAVRPPILWGDEFDGLRIEHWRERRAAARAKRESEVLAWRVDL